MNWITRLWKRRRLYDDLSEEIREHLEERTRELIEDGMSPEEAVLAARRSFGNVALFEERGRETWHWMSLRDFLADIRYGLRALRKNPSFTFVAVLTLALGIGANSAIFSLVDAILLRALPFVQPDRLVAAQNYYPQGGFVAMRTNLQAMDVAAYLEGEEFNLTGEGEPERLYGAMVSAEFFSLLGLQPEQGRVFQAGDDQPGKDAKVVLSHALWQNKFRADPKVIGRRIMLGGVSREIAGVMPPDFQFASPKNQFWVQFNFDPRATWTYWDAPWVPVVGRLREGASIEKAHTELELFQRLPAYYVSLENAGDNLADRHCGSAAAADRWRSAIKTADPLRGRRIGFVDCGCQRRQSAAGARHRPAARDGRARNAGSGPMAHLPPAAYRKHAARNRRRSCGVGFCLFWHFLVEVDAGRGGYSPPGDGLD